MRQNKLDGNNHMTSNQSALAAATRGFFRILAVCIPVLMLLTSAQGQHSEPSAGAKGMPGAQGTIEYKPTDWKGNVTTYWKDTDGIDPGSSTNVTVAHSWIDNGDDNIAIKTGTTHMSVLDNHFYSGHGMSIGSETYSGDSFLLVDGLTEDHTTSGIRIKSNVTRGGPVHDLTYQNICMRGVKNPIAISPYYTNQTTEPFEDPKYAGDRIPDYKAITIRNVSSATAGDVLIAGLNEAHRTEVSLDNVKITGITPGQVHGHFATVTLGPGGSNIDFSGTDLKVVPARDVEVKATAAAAFSCEGKFLPMR